MLLSMPLELLNKILDLVDKTTLSNLSLTCRYSYIQVLPVLYAHLNLGYHTHIRYLHSSKERNVELSQALTTCTKELTLKSRQNGNYWRAEDLIQLLGNRSPVTKLTFDGFTRLSMQNVHEIVAVFPKLTHLEFKYCQLYDQNRIRHISMHQKDIGNRNDPGVTTLTLLWTDFTAPAIDSILSYSKLDTIHLGANHNKYDRINDYFVKRLPAHCPSIQNLSVYLPLVKESTLSDTVRQYGNQLKHISLWCDGPTLIQTIADNCHQVEHLALRGGTSHGLATHEPILNIIRQCKLLATLAFSSFPVQDIPIQLWHALATRNETKQIALDALEHVSSTEKQQPQYTNATQQNRRGSSRIYHYAINEELLAQRYYYNQNNNRPLVHKTDLNLSFPYTLI